MGYYNDMSLSYTNDDAEWDRMDGIKPPTCRVPAQTTSDLRIPSKAAILAAASDYRESAERTRDAAALRQIDRLMDNVSRGARLAWQLGVLHVGSPSGQTYRVSRAGCDCLNGQKGKAQCWHFAIRNLLEDMLEQAALEDDGGTGGDEPPDLCATLERRLVETAQILDTMRAAQLGRRIAERRAAYAYA